MNKAMFRIILYAIVIILLVGILTIGIGVKLLSFDHAEETETSSGIVSSQEVRRLNIDWAAGDVTIRAADVTDIFFSETCDANAKPMTWQKKGDTLSISFTKDKHRIGIHDTTGKTLLVEVPRDWVCQELDLEIAAAALHVENLTVTELDFEGASGNCNFSNCTVGSLEMSAAAGRVTFSGCLDQMEFEGGSSDLEMMVWNTPQSISLEAGTGNLDLTLPADCGFAADVSVLSGDFSSDFPTNQTGNRHVYGDGSCRIEMEALSGNITIHQGQEAENCDH